MVRQNPLGMDLVKIFQKYASKNAFFYVALDPERALGLEDILSNYTIICPYKSELTEELSGNNVQVVALEEHLNAGEVEKIVQRGTYGILQSDFVQKYIKAHAGHRKPHIMVLKNSQLIEDFCKKRGWKLLAPKAKIAEQFENKISQYRLLKGIVTYPKTVILGLEKIYAKDKAGNNLRDFKGESLVNIMGGLKRSPPCVERKLFPALYKSEALVLQFNRGHSGNSTFFVKSAKDIEAFVKKFPKREAKISQYIKGKTFTLNCLVLKRGQVITGSISEQITGLKSATNNPNTTCGNDFSSPRKLAISQVKSIQAIAQKVGAALHRGNYMGLFGIDVIIQRETGKVYFLEVNTHQPASISFEAQLHERIGKIPLFWYFILDSLGEKTKFGAENFPSIILPISARQIIYRNKSSKTLPMEEVVKRYKGKGLLSRKKFIKPNEEIYRIQR